LDDGRSYAVAESGVTTPSLTQIDSVDSVPELDAFELVAPADTTSSEPITTGNKVTCELCGERLEPSGDNWGMLCPECAGPVSMDLDRKGLTDEDRDAAVALLRNGPGSAVRTSPP